MSSKRPASAASATVSHLDPSTVEFGGYLDRVYDQNMLESAAAHAAHVKASVRRMSYIRRRSR